MVTLKELDECEYYEQKAAVYKYQLKKIRKRLNKVKFNCYNGEDSLDYKDQISLKEYLKIMISSSIGIFLGTESFMENPTISEFVKNEIIALIVSYIVAKNQTKLFGRRENEDIDSELYDLELDDLAMMIYDLEEKEKNARREVTKIVKSFVGNDDKNKTYKK